MIEKIKPLAGLYQVNSSLVKRALKDLSTRQISNRPGPDANSMHWILGHLVVSRYSILQMLGSELRHHYGEVFSKGAEAREEDEYPSVESLLEEWNQLTQELSNRLEMITEEDLVKSIDRKLPGVESNVLGGITFLHFHESYHVGQLAYIRKLHNQSQLVG